VKKPRLTADDEQINREVEHLRRTSGIWTPREKGPVELNDQVVADVIVKSFGPAQEGAEPVESETKLDNIEIYVRPHGFVGAVPVEKLDELLVGAETGQTRESTVDVPKTHFREEYRGKKVDLKITIKDIKWLKPAELDPVFLKKYDADSKEALREKIRDTLRSRLEAQARNDMSEQMYKYLLDNTSFDLPLDVAAKQATTVLRRQYYGLLSRGLTKEEIDEQMEQLRASSEEQAKEQLKTYFIIDKIAEKLSIEVSEEEINGHIAQAALRRGQRPEKLRENMERDGSLAQFRLEVRQEKCIAKLLESAAITEAEPEPKQKKSAKAAKKTIKKGAETQQ
jgi:trigger factor